MSHRLQLLIPEELDARVRKAAHRGRVSMGAWVRGAIEDALSHQSGEGKASDRPLRLASFGAPTADVEKMIAEIESGRS